MTRRVLWSVTVVAALALLVTGCGDDGGVEAGGEGTTAPTDRSGTSDTAGHGGVDALSGRTFVATQVTGHDLVPGSELRLTFDGDLLVVAAGCNSMRSSYTFAEGRLAWTGDPAATMMACDPELMAQDDWAAGLLTAGVEAEVTGDELVLTSGDVHINLVAEPSGGAAGGGAAGSSPSLYGPTWTLTTIIDGETASSVPAGAEPATLTFAEDGSVGLFTGCNSGSTSVEVTDTTAVFSSPMTTLIGCEGPAGEVEAAVLAVVDGEVELVLDADQLTLGKGEAGLVFTAGPA